MCLQDKSNALTKDLVNRIICFKTSLKIPKGLIRIRKSKKNRQQNGHDKSTKGKTTIYKHTHKTKDRVTRTPLKSEDELRFCRRVSNFCLIIKFPNNYIPPQIGLQETTPPRFDNHGYLLFMKTIVVE
jgi:hypothetical protein